MESQPQIIIVTVTANGILYHPEIRAINRSASLYNLIYRQAKLET
jgi:hypothetical protein